MLQEAQQIVARAYATTEQLIKTNREKLRMVSLGPDELATI